MSKQRVLVVGASGTVGAGVVKLLKAKGHVVRATTSQASKTGIKDGVETVVMNVVSGEGIHAAFEGVDRAFFLSPPGYADQYKNLSPLIQEAKRRGLKKTVLMTAMGANANEASPFRRAELELERSGLTYNIVRPNWFFQNFNTFWVQGIKEQQKVIVPGGRAKVSFIDAADISEVAAKLLVEDHFNNQAIDITGPRAVDHDEVARALSQVTGKTITYLDAEPAGFEKGLVAAGVPQDYASFLSLIFGFLREGYSEKVTDGVQRVLGREPAGLEEYARNNKAAW